MINIGDEIRIIKCSICYCPSSYVGKIDRVINIENNRVYLEKYKPVPIDFVEKINYDIELIINESVYKPKWNKIEQCPDCGTVLIIEDGCYVCKNCGFAKS